MKSPGCNDSALQFFPPSITIHEYRFGFRTHLVQRTSVQRSLKRSRALQSHDGEQREPVCVPIGIKKPQSSREELKHGNRRQHLFLPQIQESWCGHTQLVLTIFSLELLCLCCCESLTGFLKCKISTINPRDIARHESLRLHVPIPQDPHLRFLVMISTPNAEACRYMSLWNSKNRRPSSWLRRSLTISDFPRCFWVTHST